MPVRRRIVPILATCVAALVTITAVFALHSGGGTTAAPGPATPPSTSPPSVAGACTGLSATTITSGQGDTSTMPGVIAAFEYAYYHLRSAAAAMLLLTPEAAISAETLAAGIASIPIGTMHCVAITPIADTAANVHLAELHPDHTRTDYLQVINLRSVGAGPLISNIQRQG
ncbi:hypothetical protein [Nocardia sp. NPDC056000]|uniref:hypothetical protein n=1 Tax=Nocardia sp. NPDC056000 TaxID=3345674 RepID=UPI0035DA98DF